MLLRVEPVYPEAASRWLVYIYSTIAEATSNPSLKEKLQPIGHLKKIDVNRFNNEHLPRN